MIAAMVVMGMTAVLGVGAAVGARHRGPSRDLRILARGGDRVDIGGRRGVQDQAGCAQLDRFHRLSLGPRRRLSRPNSGTQRRRKGVQLPDGPRQRPDLLRCVRAGPLTRTSCTDHATEQLCTDHV